MAIAYGAFYSFVVHELNAKALVSFRTHDSDYTCGFECGSVKAYIPHMLRNLRPLLKSRVQLHCYKV